MAPSINKVYPKLITSLPIGLLLINDSGECIFANRAFEDLANVAPGEFITRGLSYYVGHADIEKLKRAGFGESVEISFLNAGYTFSIVLRLFETSDGISYFTASDFPTQHAQTSAVEAIKNSDYANRQKELMQQMMDCTESILYSVNQDGMITAFNKAANQAVIERKGRSIQLGDYWPDIVSGNTGLEKERMIGLLNYVLMGNRYNTIEDMIIDSENTITYSVQASPIFDSQNQPIGAMLCAQNITIQTRLQKEAREKSMIRAKELEQWNRFYDTLLAVLAHDLRQPLSAIVMSADLISYTQKDFSKEELKYIMNELSDTSKKSIELLQGLLYWVKSKKENFSYKPEHLNLYDLFEEANALFIIEQRNNGISFKNNIEQGFNISAHYQMMLFVCRNLISNATKHAPPNSSITIRSEREGEKTIISVHDEGKGMTEEQLSKLFSINESSTHTSAVMGAGIALTIANDMINQMKGKIHAESEQRKGTTFYVTFIP